MVSKSSSWNNKETNVWGCPGAKGDAKYVTDSGQSTSQLIQHPEACKHPLPFYWHPPCYLADLNPFQQLRSVSSPNLATAVNSINNLLEMELNNNFAIVELISWGQKNTVDTVFTSDWARPFPKCLEHKIFHFSHPLICSYNAYYGVITTRHKSL